MVTERGGLYWAVIHPVSTDRPATRRPVLVIQVSSYNESRLAAVLVAVITSNTGLATMPGNTDLSDWIGTTPQSLMRHIDRGLRLVLDL